MRHANKKVFILASNARSLMRFRGRLIEDLIERDCQVFVSVPNKSLDKAMSCWLEDRGIQSIDIRLDRTGLNPFTDLRSVFYLFNYLRKIRPDILLAYTIKPVVYGMIVGWFTRVPRRVALITGLGYTFSTHEQSRKSLRWIATLLYKASLRVASQVIFQNPDDAILFRKERILPPKAALNVVNGSGVDLTAYMHQPLPIDDEPVTFLMIARLLNAKGVREFAEAAKLVRAKYSNARFRLVGGYDQNPDAIDLNLVRLWQSSGVIEWIDDVDDVKPYLADCHVFVLPSYREGTPRSALEALATGRAIITTAAPGCKETVIERENGFMVPVCDFERLAAAMMVILASPGLIAKFGQRSRQLAFEKFEVGEINRRMLKIMGVEN